MKTVYASALILISMISHGQTKPADTVIIKVGERSKITVTIQDKNDLETMKQYDFQKLMNDLISKLEEKDTTNQHKPAGEYLKEEPEKEGAIVLEETHEEDFGEEENWTSHNKKKHGSSRRTYHSINFDLGMNNYLSGGTFPDQDNSLYTVKPWGSWYVGINSTQRTRVSTNFFLEWAFGVSWYNFKFQNEQTIITKDDNSVLFSLDQREADFRKSKLTATYLNASLVPMIDFGGNRRKPSFFDGDNADSFRIGAGPYVGYRINSYTKQKFEVNGDVQKPRDHDNFYLNNLRYGIRMQMGFDDVDLFFNYDLNELFIENRGPKLNAFSFGITF